MVLFGDGREGIILYKKCSECRHDDGDDYVYDDDDDDDYGGACPRDYPC